MGPVACGRWLLVSGLQESKVREAAASRKVVLAVVRGAPMGRFASNTGTTSGGRAPRTRWGKPQQKSALRAGTRDALVVPPNFTGDEPDSLRAGNGAQACILIVLPGGRRLRSRLAGGVRLPGAALSAVGADSLGGRQGTRPGHCRWSSIGLRWRPRIQSVAQPPHAAVERTRRRGRLELPRGRLAQMVRALR